MITTLEEALKRIDELESENRTLREELERYKNITPAGRRKHDETWMASYNDFVVKYEAGMSIMEIVNMGEISRRTAYRYKAYYDEVNKTTFCCRSWVWISSTTASALIRPRAAAPRAITNSTTASHRGNHRLRAMITRLSTSCTPP